MNEHFDEKLPSQEVEQSTQDEKRRPAGKIWLAAAVLSAILALGSMWWLYDQEFHYPNTEAGRMAAVLDYIPQAEDSTLPHGVKQGTPLHVVGWQTAEDRLFIFYIAENRDNVHGVLHLKRGFNGKYRTLEAEIDPSAYSGGLYVGTLTPRDTDWQLYYIAAYHCGDIHRAEVAYEGWGWGMAPWTAEKSYILSGENSFELIERKEMEQEIGIEGNDFSGLHITNMKLFDKEGTDITGRYMDEGSNQTWSSAKGTAETSMVYVFMGIVAVLGVIFVQYFRHCD